MDRGHQPVLLEEAIAALMVSADGMYVDGTFGRGGHSARILDALSSQGALLALDQDPTAALAAKQLVEKDPRFQFFAVNFRALGECVAPGTLQGVLLDLGVSSPQLDNPARGFSFTHDGPLDMRMNPDAGESAASWLAEVSEVELASVLRELGEERFSRRIAAAIVRERAIAPDKAYRSISRHCQRGEPKMGAAQTPCDAKLSGDSPACERGAGCFAGSIGVCCIGLGARRPIGGHQFSLSRGPYR